MRRKVVLLLFLFPVLVFAQNQEPLDRNGITRIMDWIGIFTMYTDVELSDKINLNEYADAAELSAYIITNFELSSKILEIRNATDINIYPRGILQSDEPLFKKLNEVSNAQYDILNEPYVTLEVLFIPVEYGYKVSIAMDGSRQLIQDIQPVKDLMNSSIENLIFTKPRDAKDRINQAIFDGLDNLKSVIGDAYISNVAIVYDNERYLNGHTIQVWKRANESIVLRAVDKNNVNLLGSVTWTNAIGNTAEATMQIDDIGIKEITVTSGSNQITIYVEIKEFEVNMEELIEKLVKEILQVLIDENETQKQEAEKTKLEQEKVISEKSTKIHLLREQQAGAPSSQEPLTYMASSEGGFYEEEPGQHLLEHPDYGEYIRKYQARELLLRTLMVLIDQREIIVELLQPESLPALLTEIKNDIAQITSTVILDLIRGDEQEMKNFLTQYLKDKVRELASKD